MPRSRTSPDSEESRTRRGSTRVQFSACGACRLRRVKCDLKELEVDANLDQISCTNCLDRGLKCVDVFGRYQAKSGKVRQGCRLQQVRSIYGNLQDEPSSRRPASIPSIQSEFFNSLFWRSFSTQHPILDPTELPARFASHIKGQNPLTKEAALLFSLIVVWAATFGVNERGHILHLSSSPVSDSATLPSLLPSTSQDHSRLDRKKRCDTMTIEIMECVDAYGIMRTPSWDGVRILLMLYPLLAEASFLQSQSVYHMALSQARVLCTNTVPTKQDATVRARVFWYAHQQDGIVGGVRGGKLVFDEEDVYAFQNPQAIIQPDPSAFVDTLAFGPSSKELVDKVDHPIRMNVFVTIPLQISAVCRRLHRALSGPRAKHSDKVDSQALSRVWEELDRCWNALESCRANHNQTGDEATNIERFVASWQIFVFQCHNTIRDLLKRRIAHLAHSDTPTVLQSMHSTSTHRCLHILPHILDLISKQLSSDDGALFKLDSGLVRDGCFFAGALITSGGLELVGSLIDEQSALDLCLRGLEEMRWVFCRADERIATLHTMWRERLNGRSWMSSQSSPSTAPAPAMMLSSSSLGYGQTHVRPDLPPILVPSPTMMLNESPSPKTASSVGSFWASYTPPTSSGHSSVATTSLHTMQGIPEACGDVMSDPRFAYVNPMDTHTHAQQHWGPNSNQQMIYPVEATGYASYMLSS